MNIEIEPLAATAEHGDYLVFYIKVPKDYEDDVEALVEDVTRELDDYFDIEYIGKRKH